MEMKEQGGYKMKQRFLSLCVAAVMTLTSVFGTIPTLAVEAAEPIGTVQFEVEGEDGAEGNGAWAVSVGQETVDGQTVTYATFPQQWANGRYIVDFPYAGTYKMQMVMSVPTATSNVHLEWAPLGGSFTTVNGNIPVEVTGSGVYRTFDGPELKVEEAGTYDLKFGSWASGGSDFRLDKFIFTCEDPVPPPSLDDPLVVEKGTELTLTESLSPNKKGSLKTNVASGDYVDYVIEVKESGDYRLTYSIASNSAAVEDAFQIQVAPKGEEEVKDTDFTIKLEPVQMTRYYVNILQRQEIHLEAGTYILRTKALNEGFSLTQVTISESVRTQVSADEKTTIKAVQYNNGKNYHAIQNATSTNEGNIGYSSQGLELDYGLDVSQSGVYKIVYNYTAAGNYTLTTQRVDGGEAYDLATSQLVKSTGASNWYDCDWTDSEAEAIVLQAGMNTLRVRWDSADINLNTISLIYEGSAEEYVTGLLEALPEREDLTLEDEAQVDKAKNSYDILTDAQKGQIAEGLVTKLNDALAQISALQLAKAVTDNQTELEKEFSKYVESDYRPEKWQEVVSYKDAGLENIGKAATIEEADKALKDAKAAMEAVVKKLKAIAVTQDRTVMLAQSKAYRKNGFLNSNVQVGNYADYFIDVKEAGAYTFTYALYADEAVNDAFVIRYDASEYPETLENEYARVSVPKIDVEGNLVKEIRGTIFLEEGEQTVRFEALSDKVRLNRITIQKQKAIEMEQIEPGEVKVINASDFTEAQGSYVIAASEVRETAEGTALDYLVALDQEQEAFISYHYAYAGSKEPQLELSIVDADGKVTSAAVTKAGSTQGAFQDSEQTAVTLPAGNYRLRVTMKNDGVDLKSLMLSGDSKDIPAEGIQLNAYKVQLSLQGTFQLTGILTPENTTSSITWKSSNEEVATVQDGLVTAIKNGTAVITAAANGKTAECTVVVGSETEVPSTPDKVPSFIKKVEAQLSNTVLYIGGNTQKTSKVQLVVPTGATLAKVEYATSNAKVATTSQSGVVTAKAAGTAVITIKVTLTNGESASLVRQVTVKKAYIKLKKANYSVKKGKSVNLKATAFGSSKKVTFKIANKKGKKLAQVTKAGKFTGKAKGTVKVVATSGKVKKTFRVKVK